MRLPNIDIEVLEKFVGENSEIYLAKWKKMMENRNIISWNWSAFFCHIFWFAYRKMYYYVYFFIGLIFFRRYIINYYEFPAILNYVFKYLIWFVIGAIANYLYLLHAEKKIKELITNVEDNISIGDQLGMKGGVSSTSVFVTLFIFILLFTLPLIISFFK